MHHDVPHERMRKMASGPPMTGISVLATRSTVVSRRDCIFSPTIGTGVDLNPMTPGSESNGGAPEPIVHFDAVMAWGVALVNPARDFVQMLQHSAKVPRQNVNLRQNALSDCSPSIRARYVPFLHHRVALAKGYLVQCRLCKCERWRR
jgi:hypothetical protein